MKFIRSFKRMAVIADKEWIQIRRDMRSLILAIIAPTLLILLFGYALTVDVRNVAMAVYDQDRSSFSRQFIERFSHTEYLRVERRVERYSEIDRLIEDGSIAMGMVLPRGFEKRFRAGKPVDLQLIVDGSDSTSAMVSIGYVKAIVANYNVDIKVNELRRVGIGSITMPVEVKSRIWYNPELLSKNFIIPGLVVLILAIISALIASLTISREWERGTMETLITTPVRGYEIVFGKLVPYLIIGLFDVLVTLSVGRFVFGVPIKGSFTELYLLALLFLAGTSGMGILISSATRVQVLSVQVSMVATYLPSFILSGFIFPIKNMPYIIQAVTYLIPAKYLIVIIKGIALKGIAASMMWTQILFLACFAVVVLGAAVKKMSLKLPKA